MTKLASSRDAGLVQHMQIIIQHINRSKHKNHMIISIDAEKNFNKIQYHFMTKALMKVGIDRMYLNIMKAMNANPVANIIFNREKMKSFPLISPLLVNIVLEFLARAIGRKKK
jgi:hypothetical protein